MIGQQGGSEGKGKENDPQVPGLGTWWQHHSYRDSERKKGLRGRPRIQFGHVELEAAMGYPEGGLSLCGWAPATQAPSPFHQVLAFLAQGFCVYFLLAQ